MRTACVKYSILQSGARRCDASYHINDAVQYRNHLSLCPYSVTTIEKEASNIFLGNIFSRIYVADETHGVPYLSASEMQKAELKTGKFLSKKQAEQLRYLMLDKDWILISCSGTLGNCVYTDKRYSRMIGTHDLIRLIPEFNQILPGVLYAFLSSKYGYAMLTHSQYGSVVQHTNPDQIKEIPLPVFPKTLQEEVHALITESAHLREEADAARQKAISFFDSYSCPKQRTVFAKRLSECTFSLTAFNNNLNVDEIKKKYSRNKSSLSSLTDSIFAPPLFKHIYLSVDNGHPFLTGREMTFQNQRYYRWLSPRGVKNINEYTIERGMLLVYKSGTADGGILGHVVIADDNLAGACLSDHVIRLRFKDFSDACWAYCFLKSKAGEVLLQSLATGTMIPFITPDRLGNLEIPSPDETKNEIKELIETYLSKRVEGNNKENTAIRLIEEEIEKWQS